jgi:3-oxoacyl-[acyl-carrier-protein] synthase II
VHGDIAARGVCAIAECGVGRMLAVPATRMRRIVVTGLGVVSPLGIGLDRFWDSIAHGVGGIGYITAFDASALPSQIAGEVRGFDPEVHLPRRDVVRTDRFIHFALIAAQEALSDAKLTSGGPRVGVAIGTGMGGQPLLLTTYDGLRRDAMRGVPPYAMLGFIPSMAASWVSMRAGAQGPIAVSTAGCAASAQAIGDAARFIARGDADVMIAGGAEAAITPLMVACFSALRALSTRNDDPATASRPFDRGRDGFVIAEGAAIVVLEELEHARRRGAHIRGELIGYGVTADAHHPTAPSVDGPARAMALALAEARVAPEAVDYINAHGTSTPHNDANETRAIRQVFGAHAYRVAVSSTKSMTGHLLGAAGAAEAVATVLALEQGIVPPTINYGSPDPECDLDYVPNRARRAPIVTAVSNSFAFGGINVSLVFRKWEDPC